ncbi:hypothetical protein CEXT_293431, partial [Caerostris extrusa]
MNEMKMSPSSLISEMRRKHRGCKNKPSVLNVWAEITTPIGNIELSSDYLFCFAFMEAITIKVCDVHISSINRRKHLQKLMRARAGTEPSGCLKSRANWREEC